MTDTETITRRLSTTADIRDFLQSRYPGVNVERMVERNCERLGFTYEAPLEIMTFERFEARVKESSLCFR